MNATPRQPISQSLAHEIEVTRGILPETLHKLGVEQRTGRGSSEWIAFTYRQHGQPVAAKYRQLEPKRFFAEEGGKTCLYNFDALLKRPARVIITEGEFDAATCVQAGFEAVVSVPTGAPGETEEAAARSGRYAYLDEAKVYLDGAREIVIASDGDPSGRRLARDLALRLGKARCRVVAYPDGCKDLNDVLINHGPEAIVRCIEEARWCSVPGLALMSDLPEIDEPPVHRLGMGVLDKSLGFRRGDFSVLTGIPSHGKTTFMNDAACRLIERYNWQVCFCSPEQTPQTDHLRALTGWKNRKPMKDQTREEKAAAFDWINRSMNFIVTPDEVVEDTEVMTVDWLLETMAASVIRFGTDMFVIDPWNELDHSYPREQTLTQYTGYAIRKFKKFAKHYDVHVTVVAHPSKMARDKASGELPMPTLYDISDSAHWNNRTDLGVIVHRTEEGSVIKVAKSRYWDQIGPTGSYLAAFHPLSNRFQVVEEIVKEQRS